ncbi:MAG: ABC transporter substrate-binding protein [Blautia sp.]|nr:ABC transporter substrate-binding protein [Blautia sp.]
MKYGSLTAALFLAAAVMSFGIPVHAADETAAAVDHIALTTLPAEVAVNERGILTVGYVKIGSESDWRIACNKSMDETFTRENGYSLLVNDAQQKHEKQVKAVREFISQEVDYILLDPIVETGWAASLEEAAEAGIPVIVFDREIDAGESVSYTVWLGSDFYLEGQRACAWLEAFLEEQGFEGPLQIVHIQGTIDSSAQLGRTRALDEALQAHPEWKLLDRQPGEFTTAKGKEVMVDMLARLGDQIQVVYCENDNEAYGAIDAIREAGRTVGTDLAGGEILVLSFDATHAGLQMTMDGQIAVNTECAPEYGPLLSQLIQQLEQGEEPEWKQYVREAQFSAVPEPAAVTVNGEEYEVTPLTKELMESRNY